MGLDIRRDSRERRVLVISWLPIYTSTANTPFPQEDWGHRERCSDQDKTEIPQSKH